jgi:hypothetical protein
MTSATLSRCEQVVLMAEALRCNRSSRLLGMTGLTMLCLLALVAGLVRIAPSASAADRTVTPVVGSASPGQHVTVTGTGWTPSGSITLELVRDVGLPEDAANQLLTVTADAAGDLSARITIPKRPAGRYVLQACEQCAPPGSVSKTVAGNPLSIVPNVHLSPQRTKVGGVLNATGAGWRPRYEVYLFLGSADQPTPGPSIARATPGADGTFGASLTVPKLPVGTHTIVACQLCNGELGPPRLQQLSTAGSLTQTAVATYTITRLAATLLLSPGAGQPGDVIEATGSGWDAEAGGVLIFDSTHITSLLDAIATSDPPQPDGTFSVSFPMPDLPAGSHVFLACQGCERKGYLHAPYTVQVLPLPPAAPPTLTVDPTAARPGVAILVGGGGWKPLGGAVFIFASGQQRLDPTAALASVQPNEDGTISARLTVPDLKPRDLELFACQSCSELAGISYATAAFTVARAPGGSIRLVLGLTALIAAVVGSAGIYWTIGLIRRARRSRRLSRQSTGPRSSQPASRLPHFQARAGGGYQIDSWGPALPSLRLVPRPDRTPDGLRVEVRR